MITKDLKKLPGGLWPVMLTPFKDNNEIDITALNELVEFYLQSGSHGLFANCLSSEMFQLTDEERLLIVRTVMKAVNGRVPVVASGTFSHDIPTCADFIKKIYNEGSVAVIVITNQMATIDENDSVFKRRTEQLLKLTGNIPLGMYECPAPYKRLLSPEMMHWLAGTNRFFYHKDTSCDPDAIQKKLKSIKGSSFAFFNANTTTALYSLTEGGDGISPIGANFYPEMYSVLYNEYKAKGEGAELIKLNAQLDLMDAIANQSYPLSAKYFLNKRGLNIREICRIPYKALNAEGEMKLKALMKTFEQMKEVYTFKA
ncbi:MAG: dihydrodipicolinate synthase family protein [Chitinophagaceae bacterium]